MNTADEPRLLPRLGIGAGLLLLLPIGVFGVGIHLWLASRSLDQAVARGIPASQIFQAQINTLTLNLYSFLANHDPVLEERIRALVRNAAITLEHCQERLADSRERQQLQATWEPLRSAALGLLDSSRGTAVVWTVFESRQKELRSLIDDRLAPGVKSNQVNALARLEALQALQADMGFLGQSVERLLRTHQPEARQAAQTAQRRLARDLETWENVWSGRRRRGVAEISEMMPDLVDKSRQLLNLENTLALQLQAFDSAQRDMTRFLTDITPALAPMGRSAARQMPVWIVLLVMGVTGGIGIGLAFIWVRRHLLLPYREIEKVAEQAATGDMSRPALPTRWRESAAAALSINRLIAVLARSENLVYHLASLVETSGDAIIGCTLDGIVLSWNKGAQRLYGYRAEEVKGASVAMLSPLDNGLQLRELLNRVRQGEKVKPFEMVHQGKNSRVVEAMVRVACIYDSTRQVIGVSMCIEEAPDSAHKPRRPLRASDSSLAKDKS